LLGGDVQCVLYSVCAEFFSRTSENLSVVFKLLGTELIMIVIIVGNACYHSVQNLLSSRLLSKNTKIRVYRTIILPVVLYGCQTWSLTWREEQRLRVFENRVLRRIFGPKRDKVTGEWKRLHKEELNDLYSSPNIIRVIKWRRMRWAGHVAHMWKREVPTGF
jgi:hypothetical protein